MMREKTARRAEKQGRTLNRQSPTSEKQGPTLFFQTAVWFSHPTGNGSRPRPAGAQRQGAAAETRPGAPDGRYFPGLHAKKTGKAAGVLKENVIFAKPARRKPFTGREVWVYIYGRRLLDALFLTIRNFATSHLAQDKATVDALWVCLGQPVLNPCVKGTDRRRLTNISAWASALLVSARWAMRRPRIAGRAMVQTPALFHARTRTLNSLSGELKGKSKPSDR